MEEKSIFVILSQSGSMPARFLKFFTHDEYNHVSISLRPDLEEMYSFGRLTPYNPFHGGFVKEGKNVGTFLRFKKTKVLVLELKIDEEKYNKIKNYIDYFLENKVRFRYNYLGVFLAYFRMNYSPKYRFYCSQFVRSCLAKFEVENSMSLPKIAKPVDFLKLTRSKIIFQGLLKNYVHS